MVLFDVERRLVHLTPIVLVIVALVIVLFALIGTDASFEDTSDGWRAGEAPGDSIGPTFSTYTYTETEVVCQFGSAYSRFPPLCSVEHRRPRPWSPIGDRTNL